MKIWLWKQDTRNDIGAISDEQFLSLLMISIPDNGGHIHHVNLICYGGTKYCPNFAAFEIRKGHGDPGCCEMPGWI